MVFTLLIDAGCGSVPATRRQTPAATSAPLLEPVLLARQDLAQRLGLRPEQVQVVGVEERVWPDACLGLPAPEMCMPRPTPGYRVTLDVRGMRHVYHTDRGTAFRYAGPGDPSPAP